MNTPSPIDELRRRASERSSGEFIYATSSIEIHVFLQRGRVAWATEASHPFEFARFLKARCNIEDDAFRSVIEECRRSRRPLGETLVAWQLASWGDVYAALHHQIRLALGTLASCRLGSAMFLPREKYAAYDEKLTFELTDLLLTTREPAAAPGAAAPASGGPAAASSSLARQLLEAVKGAAWVQLVEDGMAVDSASRAGRPGVSVRLVAATLGDGADFFALRTADGSLMGARLTAGGRELWCRVAADSTFGAAVAALWSVGCIRRKTVAPGSGTPASTARWESGVAIEAWRAELEQAFEFGRDVTAAALLAGDGEVIAAVGRGGFDPSHCEELIRRRAAVLALPAGELSGDLESLGFVFRTMVTGEDSLWCFGSQIYGAPAPVTLWVLVGRDSSQGVGWACLTSVARGLSRRGAPQ